MTPEFVEELRQLLSSSKAVQRKFWAQKMIRESIPVHNLLPLLHGEKKVAQRFTWLIGDLLELEPAVVSPCLPMLFSLRDQMPFPGMRRCVAKCLWLAGIPPELEQEAIAQLFDWLKDPKTRIGVKHYASKLLFDLAINQQVDGQRVLKLLLTEGQHENVAHAKRLTKLAQRLRKKLSTS